MEAKGPFEVNLNPQQDETAPAGRMLIDKKYSGDFIGRGTGQMLSKRTPTGTAVYTAIEEVEGNISDLSGSFTLVHVGLMSSNSQNLDIQIVEGSGTGDFEGIKGTMTINQSDGEHFYVLSYTL